jgi:hypothetical protein
MVSLPTKLVSWSLLALMAYFVCVGSVFAGTTGFTTETVQLPASVVEGEEIELMVSFINEEEKSLTGKINFYNKDELLGSRELTLIGGQTGEYILNWTAVLGDHSFVAKAEQLKLEGSSVSILGPETEPKELTIGFKNSGVAESLREKGGFGAIVAGIMDEVQQFFVPIINSLDTWRLSKIDPLEATKLRVDGDKEGAEGKVKPLLVVHSLILSLLILIVSNKAVFFVLVCVALVWLLVRLVKLFRRIVSRDYSDQK